MPYLIASAVVIHYEEALYQVYVPLTLFLPYCQAETFSQIHITAKQLYLLTMLQNMTVNKRHSSSCDSAVKVQDFQVVNLGSSPHVIRNSIWPNLLPRTRKVPLWMWAQSSLHIEGPAPAIKRPQSTTCKADWQWLTVKTAEIKLQLSVHLVSDTLP